MTTHLPHLLGGLLSAVTLLLPVLLPGHISGLEAVATVSLAWSVWLLARNHPAGWWVGLVGIAAYGVVFYRAKLFAEVGLQVVYFVTSLQAIWIWLRTGPKHGERPIGRVSLTWAALAVVVAVAGTAGLRALLIELRGAAPFWDALTTVVSLIAHVFLMARLRESWILWVAVDTIYVPLYWSRQLYLTSALYLVFWGMAAYGLLEFYRRYREQQEGAAP